MTPGGLFIVDTKASKDPIIAAGRVFRGQADVTDEFDGLADLASPRTRCDPWSFRRAQGRQRMP